MSSQSPSADLARSFARSARDDLDALVALHEIPGIADAVVGFHAQQAVEKALKQRSSAPEANFTAPTICASSSGKHAI